jgi:hypothetical protein
MATTYSLLAPNAQQQFAPLSGASYTSDANGLITGVALADVRDLVGAGCVPLGAGVVTDSAAFNQYSGPPQLVAAAGATQGAATLLTKAYAVLTTVTASARGVKLPVAVTGMIVQIYDAVTQGCKVYPNTNGRIGSAATNVAVVVAGFKGNVYRARNTTQWDVIKGA